MKEIKGERLYVALGASKARRRLNGHGFGVRNIYTARKAASVVPGFG